MSNVKKKKTDNQLTVFDHVDHIREVQNPNYYNNLSDENKKTFNHFMILRALSMDEYIIEDMASLYQYFDKIPSPQFYKLLIAFVPKNKRYYPWIKSKIVKNKPELVDIVSSFFKVPTYQANSYINILLKTDSGSKELINICQSMGLNDNEIEKMFTE